MAWQTPDAIKRGAEALGVVAPLKQLKRSLILAQYGALMQFTVLVSHLPVRNLRHRIYRRMGMRLGSSACIHRGVEVREPRRLEIGEGSIIGFDSILDARSGIKIGRQVNVSSQVAIWTRQHDLEDPDFRTVGAPVSVGDRAWLSFRSTILPGVRVGEGAVVAAGAVVTRDVPPFTIVAGIPARVIGERPRGLVYDLAAGFTPWFV